MAFLKDVIVCKLNEELKAENDKELYKYSIDSKRFFNNLLQNNNAKKLPVKKIVEFIAKEIKEVDNSDSLQDFDCSDNRRGILTFTAIENVNKKEKKQYKIHSNEVFLERIFTYYQNKKNKKKELKQYKNQYKIGDICKEALDIRVENGNFVEYIELKCLTDEKNADTPFYAILECLKNYHLSCEKENISKLIILAPKDYWKTFLKEEKNITVINKLIDKFNKELKENVKIELQTLNIDVSNLQKILPRIENKLNPERTKNKRGKYNLVAHIHFNEIWNDIKDLELFSRLENTLLTKF